jgi:uncharacterized SAM-binding protein YcdF (DUF218 family)
MHFTNWIKKELLLLVVLLLSVVFYSCSYSSKAAKKLLVDARAKGYDAVVVPGIPFKNGKWDFTMKGRVYWAKYLYDNGITKNIIFSGSSVYSPYYEGIIMALYAEALGIPKENIFYETEAEHSTENIYYSYQLAKKLGFTKIALASDLFQTKSLRSFAHKKLSRDVGMIPMVMDTLKILQPLMIDPPIDSLKAFNKDFVSIKQREGFFKRLKGTMGYNIKKKKV